MSTSNAMVMRAEKSLRKNVLEEFFQKIAEKAGCQNFDNFLRSGEINDKAILLELGRYFLQEVLGFEDNEFIPFMGRKLDPDFVPQSENYYPWVLYFVPSSNKDLVEVFDKQALQYLHSEIVGNKKYCVILNGKEISVFDLNSEIQKYRVDLAKLYDSFSITEANLEIKRAQKAWQEFFSDFGPGSAKDKKAARSKEVSEYVEPKDDRISFVKRFGHLPNFEKPIGWGGQTSQFRKIFPTKDLPFVTTEQWDWNGEVNTFQNRLIWGDNLAVMRCLPSESIDLIYIDPPFFSGRNYNCIFGDNDEMRTFCDIWEGGLPTYLAWLNARLWEMRRLLKPAGSLYIHIDWHASHYVKVELDKIFGYDNFLNEIVWSYKAGAAGSSSFGRKHDVILRYSKDNKKVVFNSDPIRIPYAENTIKRLQYSGAREKNIEKVLARGGKVPTDVWEIGILQGNSQEKIGYPTQKPEELIERIIKASSNSGDIVADFFSGGGTTASVSEKLGRKWIGVDISRIAVSVARDRVASIYRTQAGISALQEKPSTGFTVENHSSYYREDIRRMDYKEYVSFILKCYEATPFERGEMVQGIKDERVVYILPPKKTLTKNEITKFHKELNQSDHEQGVILYWKKESDVESHLDKLQRGSMGRNIQIVQVKILDLDSHEFKGENIRFLNRPIAVIRSKHIDGLRWQFDGTNSVGQNEEVIHFFQWDFNYTGRFSPMTKPNFKNDQDGDGNPLNDLRLVEHAFPKNGAFRVALRIIDKKGAEAIHEITVDTETKKTN